MKEKILLLILIPIVFIGCKSDIEEINLFNTEYEYFNQNGKTVNLSSAVKDKNFIISFIFLNCPDICPLTTHNISKIQSVIKKLQFKNYYLITITFDPARDNIKALKTYIAERGYDESNWDFLTGKKEITDSLMKRLDYFAIPGDTTVATEGKKNYYFMHTDKIFLFDKNLNLIKSYEGSQLNINEVEKDIRKLGD